MLMKTRAFKYGEAFFTTIRVEQSTLVWFEEHAARLARSLAAFDLAVLDIGGLREAAYTYIGAKNISDGFLRIQVWGDSRKAEVYIEGDNSGNQPGKTWSLTTSSYCRLSHDPLLSHKSSNYLVNLLAYRQAQSDGFDEAFFLNERQEVCEGSRSNIFWSRAEVLYTPDMECGLLPGICRSHIIQIAARSGLEVRSGRYTSKDIFGAEEIFLTNSLKGIMPVSFLAGRGRLEATELTMDIARLYQEDVDSYINTIR